LDPLYLAFLSFHPTGLLEQMGVSGHVFYVLFRPLHFNPLFGGEFHSLFLSEQARTKEESWISSFGIEESAKGHRRS